MSQTQTVAPSTVAEGGQAVVQGQPPAEALAAGALGALQSQLPPVIPPGQSEQAQQLFRSASPERGQSSANGHSPHTPTPVPEQQGGAGAAMQVDDRKEQPPAAQAALEGGATAVAATGQQQSAPSASGAAGQALPPQQQPAADRGMDEQARAQAAYLAAQQQMAVFAQQWLPQMQPPPQPQPQPSVLQPHFAASVPMPPLQGQLPPLTPARSSAASSAATSAAHTPEQWRTAWGQGAGGQAGVLRRSTTSLRTDCVRPRRR